MYCPKCKSKLYPIDDHYMKEYGVCSYCTTYGDIVKKEVERADKEKKNEKR